MTLKLDVIDQLPPASGRGRTRVPTMWDDVINQARDGRPRQTTLRYAADELSDGLGKAVARTVSQIRSAAHAVLPDKGISIRYQLVGEDRVIIAFQIVNKRVRTPKAAPVAQ